MRALLLLVLAASTVAAQGKEGDYVAKNFTFNTGEKLAELKLHYTTLGEPHRDARRRVTNAVMILHGTGGSGRQFFRPQFADVLFAPGALLEAAIRAAELGIPAVIGAGEVLYGAWASAARLEVDCAVRQVRIIQ